MNLNLDLFGFCLCERRGTYGLEMGILQEGSVGLRRRRKCKDRTNVFSLKVIFGLFVLN
jgi:hypothetical protein